MNRSEGSAEVDDRERLGRRTTGRFLYVLSTGRSGSTLLGHLLDGHPELLDAGEVQLLPHLLDEGSNCRCGEPLATCPLWSSVTTGLSAIDRSDLDLLRSVRETRDAGRVLRPGLLLRMVVRRPPPLARRYGQVSAELFERLARTAATQAGRSGPPGGVVPVVVDTSKDPYRLALLAASPVPDPRGPDPRVPAPLVVLLVRHPLGVVASLAGDGASGVRRLRAALRWSVQHVVMWLLLRRVPPRRLVLVRYEDLARNPAQTVEDLIRRLEVRFDGSGAEATADTATDTTTLRAGTQGTGHVSHALAGNPGHSPEASVRLDDRGQGRRRATDPAWWVTRPVARRLGYR